MVKIPDDIEVNPNHVAEHSGHEHAQAFENRRQRVARQMAQKNIAESLARPYSEVVRTVKLKSGNARLK